MGNEHGERENENWEQSLSLCFVPIFHSPVPRFSNIRPGGEICSYDVIMHTGHSKEERAWNNSKSALSKRLKAERVPFLLLPAIPPGTLKGPLRERG